MPLIHVVFNRLIHSFTPMHHHNSSQHHCSITGLSNIIQHPSTASPQDCWTAPSSTYQQQHRRIDESAMLSSTHSRHQRKINGLGNTIISLTQFLTVTALLDSETLTQYSSTVSYRQSIAWHINTVIIQSIARLSSTPHQSTVIKKQHSKPLSSTS